MKKNKTSKKNADDEKFRAMIDNPELYDEETMGGNMPNPESDDDSLAAIQDWGFYVGTKQNNQELNEQKQLDRAEKARKRKR